MFDCLRALGALDDADIEVVSLTEQDPADRSLRKLIRPILAWRARREQARLELASLPSPQAVPAADHIDPTAFREAVLEAWHDRPLEDRRQALDQLLDEVRLSPGLRPLRPPAPHHAP